MYSSHQLQRYNPYGGNLPQVGDKIFLERFETTWVVGYIVSESFLKYEIRIEALSEDVKSIFVGQVHNVDKESIISHYYKVKVFKYNDIWDTLNEQTS